MKKKILHTLWTFVKIDLLCWAVFFASVTLLTLIFYRDTPGGYRDPTPIYWVLHIIFFIAYHQIYTVNIDDKQIDLSDDVKFNIQKAIVTFFKEERIQIILMSIFAVAFEAISLTNPGPQNVIMAFLVVLVPSAAAISIPVVRTLIGLSISMFSMLLSYVLICYKKHKYWNKPKNRIN